MIAHVVVNPNTLRHDLDGHQLISIYKNHKQVKMTVFNI